jgi:nucleoside-diphosphate-sugar epimerase
MMVENAVDGVPTTVSLGIEDQTRCQTYVKDVAQGVLKALDVPNKKLKQRAFNIGGAEETSDRDTANIIQEFIPDSVFKLKGGGVNRRAFNIDAAKEQLGFKPIYTLRTGIKDHIKMYRDFKKGS